MSIFVQHDGETYGPFSREEVLEHLQQGVLAEDDLACTEDNLEGRPLKDLLNDGSVDPAPLEEITTGQEIPGEEELAQYHSAEESPVNENPDEGSYEQASPEWENQEEPATPKEVPSLLDLQFQRESRSLYRPPLEEQPGKSRKTLLLATTAAVVFIASGAAAFFLFKPAPNPPAVTASASFSPVAATGSTNQQEAKPAIVEAQEPPMPATASGSVPTSSIPPPVPATADEAMPQSSDSNTANNGMENKPNLDEKSTPESNDSPEKTPTAAKPTPRPVLAVAQRIVFPAGKDIPRGDLWFAQTTTSPKAVLLLCLPPNGDAQNAVKAEAWQDFAKQNGFILAAISFASDRDLLKIATGDSHPGIVAENLLINGLQTTFGNTPLILYGHNAGGTFAATFANWHPEKIKAWAAYTGDLPPVVTPNKISPPGILACDNELIKTGKTNAHDFFEAGRAQDKQWIYVPLAMDKESRQKSFEAFFCDYAKALMSPTDPKGIWVGIESKKLYSVVDRMRDPRGAEWLPDASLIDPWISLTTDDALPGSGKSSILQKNIATNNTRQPNLKLYLRLPSSAKTGRDVNGVIAYCTLDNKESEILKALDFQEQGKPADVNVHNSGVIGDLTKFAELNNMALLTWGTTDASLKSVMTSEDMDASTTAWEKGVNQFANETGIPKNDYLLYGISTGARFAAHLALCKPAYFLGVHIHIPDACDAPTPNAGEVLWLITTGDMDSGYNGSVQFYKQCRQAGYPIIFKAITGLGHNDNKIADDLGIRFFQYALSLRDLHDQHEAQNRMHMMVSGTQSEGPWLPSFRDPEYVGDFLNQDCYPSAQVDMVPNTLRVPLPTKDLADAWNK